MINYLLLPVTFLSSFLGTWLFIRLGNSQQWLDQPNSRSSHSNPTPTSGGVVFVLVFFIASLLAFRTSSPGFNVVLVLSLCICIAALGLADDIIKLGIGTRIMTQLLVIAGVLAIFGVPAVPLFGHYLEPEWGGYMLLALVLLWFINLFNFMDGLDGIAASQVIFICLSVFMITWNNSNAEYHTLLLLLVASVGGFLFFNVAPAKIFMGDTGSNFLAFALIVAALACTTTGITNVWVWCILASVFIVDATYTLLIRMLSGEAWYFAHRTHAYQLAAVYLNSHGKVLIAVTLINCCWLLPLAWWSHVQPQWGLAITLLAWASLIMVVRLLRMLLLDKLDDSEAGT
jgi:Fuc2NAc and GlcNAc transferase